jgi:hypothetical protein
LRDERERQHAEAGAKIEHYFLFASCFAKSCTQSMKSCASGLSVRFFNVMAPIASCQMTLTFPRGEVEGTLKSLEALATTHRDWLTGDQAKDRARFGIVAERADRRHIGKSLVRRHSAEIGRSLLTAPGVPSDRVAALRAFDAMAADAEFQEVAKKRNVGLATATGGSMQAIVAETMTAPKEVVDRVKRVISSQ